VLVVEDDADTLRLIVELLRDELEVDAVPAADAATARGLIETAPPDVVLIDGSLPDGDGFDLVAELKADARTRGVPLIAMTARYRRDETAAQARAVGCDDAIAKPFDVEDLLAKVRDWLPRRAL
jgi:DNA-binding response OmpR family regulator